MDRIRQPTAWSVKLIRIVGRNSLRYCLQVCISGSQLRAIFTPWGHLEMCGDIFGCHHWGSDGAVTGI